MGLFSRKKKKGAADTSMAARAHPTPQTRGGYVQPAQGPSDPSLPGVAGWCGSRKDGPLPHRFNYVRPDGRPDVKAKYWADPDDPQWS